MRLNTQPISEIERGAVVATVQPSRRSAFQMHGLEIRLLFFTVTSTLFAIVLVSYLISSIASGGRVDFGLLMLAIVLFVPAILAVGFVVSLRKSDSIFELREGGVLVSPNVFVLWDEIASVNFEGTLAPAKINHTTLLSGPAQPVKLFLGQRFSTEADMTLGFVLRDFDAVIQRGPSEETQKFVEPYGDTPGQSVVTFDCQLTPEDCGTLLDIARTLTQQRGVPFRPNTKTTEKLQRDEYRAGRDQGRGGSA